MSITIPILELDTIEGLLKLIEISLEVTEKNIANHRFIPFITVPQNLEDGFFDLIASKYQISDLNGLEFLKELLEEFFRLEILR